MSDIKLTTGVKEYRVLNENDQVMGVISINVKDKNFMQRADAAKERIDKMIADCIAIMSDMSVDDAYDKLVKQDAEIKQEVDYMFGSTVAKVVFGKAHCLSTHKGTTYIERFFDAILPVITKDFEDEAKASAARMEKYKPVDAFEKS